MRIKLEVFDVDTGKNLEDLGTCLTNNPNRAVQMYDQDEKWIEQGYNADIRWTDITDPAAASLGSRGGKSTSAAKRKASAANGKLGGRPKIK
jgi:hypothetical protein